MTTQAQSGGGPGVEVVASSDGSTCDFGGTDGPVLVESRSAFDTRLIRTGGFVDVVSAAVAGDRAFQGPATAAGIVGAVGFYDIVLDEGRSGPPIYREVAIAARAEGAGEVYCPSTSRIPSLSGNKVPGIGPGYTVLASRSIRIINCSTTICPEGIVEAVISTGRA